MRVGHTSTRSRTNASRRSCDDVCVSIDPSMRVHAGLCVCVRVGIYHASSLFYLLSHLPSSYNPFQNRPMEIA